MRTPHKKHSGFTLIEMIVVIVITGIIGGIVAIFLKAPVQGYTDSARRAELTDIADTAIRRMARDIRTAAPNSVRIVCGTTPCVEFLPTKDGGRYRADTPGNVLTFGSVDGSFDIVGNAVNFAANDYIIIGSTQWDGSLAYLQTSSGVLRKYTGLAGAQPTVTMDNTALPLSAQQAAQRFDVVDGAQQAVTYACTGPLGPLDSNQNGQAKLVRFNNYGFNVSQALPTTANPPILADKVSACSIDYDVSNQRFGLLAVRLTLTSGGESVTLYSEIHVNNAP